MAENSPSVRETVERSFDSTLDSVDSAEELVSGLAGRAGFNDEDLLKIGMAVREAMVNAVVHGNRYSAHKKVRFALSYEAGRLTVKISDEGEGFDVDHLPDPLSPDNLLRSSGRGIFLIRSFLDEVEIRRSRRAIKLVQLESGGIELTLVKCRAAK